MREKKFRLWDNSNNKYFHVGFLGPGSEGGYQWFNVGSNGQIVTGIDDEVDEPAHAKRFVLEEFIGLKDLDWWEGDLFQEAQGLLKQIIYEDGCFWMQSVKFPAHKIPLYSCKEFALPIPKIGNVRTTPELLKEK